MTARHVATRKAWICHEIASKQCTACRIHSSHLFTSAFSLGNATGAAVLG